MTAPRNVRYILIPDIDDTAIALQKLDMKTFSKLFPHLISPEFLEFALRNLNKDASSSDVIHYESFFPCTHRALCDMYREPSLLAFQFDVQKFYLNYQLEQIRKADEVLSKPSVTATEAMSAKNSKERAEKYILSLADCSDVNTDDNFLHRIIENLEKELGIKCINVSSIEDQDGPCGSGYHEILKPFEIQTIEKQDKVFGMKRYKNFPIRTDWTHYPSVQEMQMEFKKEPVFYVDSTTKNKQVLSIVDDITRRYGTQDDFVLDFPEDKKIIRENLLAMDPKKLPENFTVRVYSANAFDREKITYVGEIKGRKPVARLSTTCAADSDAVSSQAFAGLLRNHVVTSTSAPVVAPAPVDPSATPATANQQPVVAVVTSPRA